MIRGSTAAATSATAANTTASSGPSLPPRRIAAHSDERFGRPDLGRISVCSTSAGATANARTVAST